MASRTPLKVLGSVVLTITLSGCAVGELLSYVLNPDYPRFADGDVVRLPGLEAGVDVARREDGLWRIEAANELDAMTAVGYLQARDRLAQMDLLRHIARGEVAALLGDQRIAGKTAVESDRLGRFLGFRDNAAKLMKTTSAEELAAAAAFTRGVNAWIATGQRTLEHRLLGIDSVREWTPEDSLSIFLFLMHSLAGNADREIRRLLLACEGGIDAMERIWPTDIEFDVAALPETDWRAQTYPPLPGVVDEMRAELAGMCPKPPVETTAAMAFPGAFDDPLSRLVQAFQGGIAASNNWVVAGSRTRSGKPIVSNDPHLPHMNPPLVWGMEVKFPGLHVAGFALTGLHRVVFGHNGHVAWGATTNFVDRQDLAVQKPRSEVRDGRRIDGYDVEGELVPFELRRDTFEVRGGVPVEATVRFTKDGPLLNDIDPFVADKAPLVALRTTPLGRGTDLDAGREMNYARNAAELDTALEKFDQGCSNWVFADSEGNIGYRSPCVTPLRQGYRGTFPIPGWLRRYEWTGFFPKEQLPKSDNPQRGWLATANSRVVPANRMPSPYNNDESGPDRVTRIEERLHREFDNGGLTPPASAAIQMDVRCAHWPHLRPGLEDNLCRPRVEGDTANVARARALLCAWDGVAAEDSVAATVQALLTNASLDHAMADDLPNGTGSAAWRYAQALFQFEANVQRMWQAPADAPFWDDARTAQIETRAEILEAALVDAVATGVRLYGDDVDAWRWGDVRPFTLTHAFAGDGGPLGAVLNSAPIAIGGDTETPFKQQFPRSDREHMRPIVGPLVRLTVDLGDPWNATYSMAGGESGWPDSPWYANLLSEWRVGKGRLLTPPPTASDVNVRLEPEGTP